MKMDLHSTFSGGKAVIKLFRKRKLLNIKKYVVTTDEQPGIRTMQLETPPKGSPIGYPRYKVVTIKGVTDVIEFRKMEPIFYMTDDDAIWKELGADQ